MSTQRLKTKTLTKPFSVVFRRLFFNTLVLAALFLSSCENSLELTEYEKEPGGTEKSQTSFSTAEVARELPALHTEGRWIKDPEGNTVILRGVNIWQLDGDVYGKDIFQRIDYAHSLHVRVLRVPAYYKGCRENPDGMIRKLRAIVDYCKSKDMYCIITFFAVADPAKTLPATETLPAITFNQLISNWWTKAAPAFKGDDNVLFDLLNEYNQKIDQTTWATWKNYAQNWTNIIRNAGANNLILVGGPHWASHLEGAVTDPVDGKSATCPSGNIVYAAHLYPRQGTEVDWQTKVGVVADKYPLIMTEWGYQHHNNSTDHDLLTYGGGPGNYQGTTSEYGNAMKRWILDKNIGFTYWIMNPDMDPTFVGKNWMLLTGDNYAGGLLSNFLSVYRHGNWPGSFIMPEAELLTYNNSDQVVKVTDAEASNGFIHRVDADAINDFVQYSINVPVKQEYTVKVRVKRYSSRGKIKLFVAGVQLGGELDQYVSGPADYITYTFGATLIPSGVRTFAFKVSGKNAASSGYDFTIDKITLVPIGPIVP